MAKEKHRLGIGQHVRISERKAHRYDDIGTVIMDDGDELFMLPYTVAFEDGDSGQYDHRDLSKVTMPASPSFRYSINQRVRVVSDGVYRFNQIGTVTADSGILLYERPYTVTFKDNAESGKYENKTYEYNHSDLQAVSSEDVEQVFFIVVDIDESHGQRCAHPMYLSSQDEGGAHWTNTRYPTLHEAEAAAIRRTVLTGDKLFVMKSVSVSESKAHITAMSRQTE